MISPSHRRLSSVRGILAAYEKLPPPFPPERHLDLPTTRVMSTILTSPRLRYPVTDGISPPRLMKLLLNVNVERSLGAVHVVIPSENTVNDLIKAVIQVYVKEKRRPLLETTDPMLYQLHYSSFSLESLKAEEKLINLGSRNFFLHLKPSSSFNSCGPREARIVSKSLFPLTKFMEFML